MRIICIILGILAALCGCAEIQQKVVMDADGALAIAQAAGDQQGAMCLSAIKPITETTPQGLLSKFELFRVAEQLSQNQCSGVAAGLFVHLLSKVPFTP